jgi:hypothetical protein
MCAALDGPKIPIIKLNVGQVAESCSPCTLITHSTVHADMITQICLSSQFFRPLSRGYDCLEIRSMYPLATIGHFRTVHQMQQPLLRRVLSCFPSTGSIHVLHFYDSIRLIDSHDIILRWFGVGPTHLGIALCLRLTKDGDSPELKHAQVLLKYSNF